MTNMEIFEAAFERFKEGKVLVFSDPNTMKDFFDFLQNKGYTPTAYARSLATDLEVGFKSLVGIQMGEGLKEAWGSLDLSLHVEEVKRYYVDIEDVDVMGLLTQ